MKFTGFAGGCVGKALSCIFCIVLGVVLCLGGIALTGYIVFTKEGMMGTLEKKANESDMGLEFEQNIKDMSIMEWGKELLAVIQDMNNQTIGGMEKLLGKNVISSMIEEILGVSADKIQESTLDNIGKAISDNLTIRNAKENFGIEFPSLPLFQKEEFLNASLASAFGNFDSYFLGDVITIDENSNSVLQELKEVAIKDIGSASTDETIKSIFLSTLMTIDETSAMTLQALKYSCIESQYEKDENGQIIVDETGKPVYKTKIVKEKDENGVEIEVEYPLIGINETIETLAIKHVVEITEDSAVVLRKMRIPTQEEIDAGKASLFGESDLLISELGGSKVTEIIDNTTIGEIVKIYTEDDPTTGAVKSEPIMIALKDTKIGGLNTRINTLQLKEIFEESSLSSGALSLISSSTTLKGIPGAVTAAMTNATTATLIGKGLVSVGEESMTKMKLEQQSFIYNSNMSRLLSGVVDFLVEPMLFDSTTGLPIDPITGEPLVNWLPVSPDQKEITTTSFSSLTDFVNAYNQYESLTFTDANVSIAINAGEDAQFFDEESGAYFIPLFNLKSNTALTITGGTVKFAVYEQKDAQLVLSANQYGYAYSATAKIFESAFSGIILRSTQPIPAP